MSYIINFSDKDNTTPLEVFDKTSNTETSLTFPGKNVSGYGKTIAENFLHLLENFSKADPPANPVQGQLWYDSENEVLQIYDSVSWKAASNIQKGPIQPDVSSASIGELWVDTINQQLRIFTGSRWLLVGPQQSSIGGLKFGLFTETVKDIDVNDKTILVFYLLDEPVVIISRDRFVPNTGIEGFAFIQPGVNISTKSVDGNILKLIGIASQAETLQVGEVAVPANRFLRSDTENIVDFRFLVRNNQGLVIGNPGILNLSTSTTGVRIFNSFADSNFDIQNNQDGVVTTVIRVIGNRVGINKLDPDHALDVNGSIRLDNTGTLFVTNTASDSVQISGGIQVNKNIIVGTQATINGLTRTKNIEPQGNYQYNLGTNNSRWRDIWAKEVRAEQFFGTLTGNFEGTASQSLEFASPVTVEVSGDITVTEQSQLSFQGGNDQIKIVTKLAESVIVDRPAVLDELGLGRLARNNDQLLILRTEPVPRLMKINRREFIGNLGVPVGTIFPYAGQIPPEGYLLCDGSEVQSEVYQELFSVIGTIYNGTAPLIGLGTFRLPDLRGRFALGRDNMDNNLSVPAQTGGFRDAGGGTAGRVSNASSISAAAGSATKEILLANIPDHEHSLVADNRQFSAIRNDLASIPGSTVGLGPNVPSAARYLNSSGPIKKPSPEFQFSQPIDVMNPYLTLNYIISAGIRRI
jgi:microcystin-dependent protein